MTTARSSLRRYMLVGSVCALLGFLTPLLGQKGQNAVMNGAPTNSSAFVDASNYESSPTDICTTIKDILVAYQKPKGVVIDARGAWSTVQLNCSALNPWNGTPSTLPVSNVVLLPASTIKISTTWILPQNTRLTGAGPSATIIQAAAGFSGDMIDMGSITECGSNDCQGVVIEHLGLDGGSISGVNGIVNPLSEELSYVDDVALSNMAGTGLLLEPNPGSGGGTAVNSGPYSNISYSGSGTCVSVNGVSTRGIHGLTCIMTNAATCSSGSRRAAICLDGPNNSFEDVNVTYIGVNESLPDGILVGSQTAFTGAQSNVLMNVSGTSLNSVVHISNNPISGSSCPPGTNPSNSVCDLTILGITAPAGFVTIQDDLTSTTLTDANVGMYTLGEQLIGAGSAIGNSRITSSPSVPSWLFGGVAPPTGTGQCATGALYSCTGSGSACTNSNGTATIWGCAGTAWKKIQ